MKTSNLLQLIIVLIIFASCSEEEITKIPDPSIITQEQLFNLDENDSKKWKVTNYFSNYNLKIINDDLTSCAQDDVFTFVYNNPELIVELGNESCYANYQNAEELAVISYNYEKENEKLYLTYTRGITSSQNKVTSVTSLTLKCILLTSEKMIFANGVLGSYGTAVVLEKI
jgi:hypothetical protein